MNFINKLATLSATTILLSACSYMPAQNDRNCSSSAPCAPSTSNIIVQAPESSAPQRETEIIEVMPRDPIIVRSTGYSAPMSNKSFSKAQTRLMTMRGSKLDAYRNLAERVYGIDINSDASVSNMIAQHDEIRAYVDSYLVGAKVVSQRELQDGTFETVVELALKENFRQCVSSVEAIRSNPNCLTNNQYRTTAPTPAPTSQQTFYSVQ